MKVSKVFQGCFKKVLRVFQGKSRVVPRDLSGWFKRASREYKKSLNGVSREFQRHVKDVSRALKESQSGKCFSRKYQKKFHGYFKNVSMKFIMQICWCMDLIPATRGENNRTEIKMD